MTASPIEVSGLCKSFGHQAVLDGIAFRLDPGKVTCILGRSGTGKSVLLRLLIGLETPDSGSILLEGQDLSAASSKELNEARKKVGFLFQQSALYDSMTIGENVAFPLRRHTTLTPAARLERVHELLGSVGMDRTWTKCHPKFPAACRSVLVWRVPWLWSRCIVMFDEPTAGLDPITAAEIASLIVDLRDRRQITSIVVTHDLHTARTIADRLIVLDEGKALFDGTFPDFIGSEIPFIAQLIKDAA